MKRIGVLTSGGDAPGMNAAIRSVVRTALHRDMSVVGFKRGYNGVLMRSQNQVDDFEIMTTRSVSDKIHRGGTFLRTARCLDFLNPEVQREAVNNLRALGIEGLVCIGGDGTYKGAAALTELGLPCVGVPGTIDNDLAYTDYTIGFDTALNTACECLNKIRETSDSHERASMLTVMGRNCGDIALHTALTCGAEICMIPKSRGTSSTSPSASSGRAARQAQHDHRVRRGRAQLADHRSGEALREHEQLHDIVPHHNLITSSQVAMIIEALSGHETRSTLLGYIQRGGSPSARDRLLATQLGAHAANLLADDRGGLAVGVRGTKLIEVPFADVQNGEHAADSGLADLVDVMAVIGNWTAMAGAPEQASAAARLGNRRKSGEWRITSKRSALPAAAPSFRAWGGCPTARGLCAGRSARRARARGDRAQRQALL